MNPLCTRTQIEVMQSGKLDTEHAALEAASKVPSNALHEMPAGPYIYIYIYIYTPETLQRDM